MIKKILFILVSVVLLHNAGIGQTGDDQRTVSTRIADLLNQMPANDATLFKSNINDMANLGVDGYVTLINGLKAPGTASNALLEYSINGFSTYATQTGQEKLRVMSVEAYCKALPALADKKNKAFIISQLQLVGKDDAVSCLQGYLTDNDLADPAARALATIGTPASKTALLNALAGSEGAARLSIIEALGDARLKEAAGPVNALANATGSDPDTRKVALYALAKIADPSSASVFAAAAEKNSYKYDRTNAVATYNKYAQQLIENGQPALAEKIAKQLYEKATSDTQIGIRIAALKILVDADKKGDNRHLLAAADDKNAALRAAALGFAATHLDQGTTNLWIKKLSKVSDDAKVDFIRMFASNDIKAALPEVLKLTKSKNENVRLAAIQAAGRIGGAQVLDNLIQLTADGDSTQIMAVSDAILRMKGTEVTDKVAAALPKLGPAAQVAMLNILSARAANGQLGTVYKQLENKNTSVSTAAYNALENLVTDNDLPKLYSLLNAAPVQHEPQVQAAIIAALNDQGDNGQVSTAVLQQMEAAPATKKPLFYKILASTGGPASLKAVSDAFGNGDTQMKTAALDALAVWRDSSSAEELINIARRTDNAAYVNKAIVGYLGLIKRADYPAEEKLLMLRNVMQVAKTTAQKSQVIQDVQQAECFNALVFAGKYLDDPDLKQEAANTVMNIALSGAYNGLVVKDLLQKTMETLKGGDSDYQREAIRKYIAEMKPGDGFVPLFNGKDLTGWKGLVGDPIKRAKMDAATLAAAQQKADAEMRDSWKVIDGELHFMSHGNNLATVKQYRDFEMLVDWKIIDDKKQQGDAGIYLRGTPQVQIWDNARTNVGAEVGSGGLYNNKINESKPLRVADNKLGEWNTFRILMKGDRVTVYLNGVLVTDNVILENYWDAKLPIFAKEQIELQAHGSPVVYRDIYIREIPAVKPYELSAEEKKEGYEVLFDGTNMHKWTGNTTDYVVEDGNIAIRPKPGKGSGGNLFTKEEFGDFVFRFEFKLTPGANNGLGIRAPYEGDAAYKGMELQILDNDAPIYKDLHVYQYHGSIYGTIPAKRGFLKPVGEWNYEEVIAKGPKIKVILNGTVILDGDITEARKNGAADGKPHPGLLRNSGHIGFLGHGSTVFFRNIRVKDLNKSKN
ncbi:MAG TPA: family 16 glycoside hydrolase [Arachidicoccus sp.]|nr:family 16 glycoside hydrolase [Arachidicoccus sp.]